MLDLRTVKPCGPGTRCWCQVREARRPDRVGKTEKSADDGDKTNSLTGESTK